MGTKCKCQEGVSEVDLEITVTDLEKVLLGDLHDSEEHNQKLLQILGFDAA